MMLNIDRGVIPFFILLSIVIFAASGIAYILTGETIIKTTEVKVIKEITITEEYIIEQPIRNTPDTTDYLSEILQKVTRHEKRT